MRKIAIFTGTRAEYGLLYWILKGLKEAKDVELILFAGGMHLSHEFGYTIEAIEKDGFEVDEKMEFLLSSDTHVGISKSMGLALISAADVIERHQPDILVLLGDRFESMAVGIASMNAKIPICHIHGGETTEGAIDEAIRHSISKMAHVHFTATEVYRKRVIQLGEKPENVFNFGAPGIDNIRKLSLIDKHDLGNDLGFDTNKPYFLVTYHPVTLEKDGAVDSFKSMLDALLELEGYTLVMTYPNADAHGRELIKTLNNYLLKYKERIIVSRSFGQVRYLSLMKYAMAVVGNSSSGLIEAPSFQIPTINIGKRQRGRVMGPTIISCNDNYKSIREAVLEGISSEFRQSIKGSINPYGNGDSSDQIVKKLKSVSLENIIFKKFHNL